MLKIRYIHNCTLNVIFVRSLRFDSIGGRNWIESDRLDSIAKSAIGPIPIRSRSHRLGFDPIRSEAAIESERPQSNRIGSNRIVGISGPEGGIGTLSHTD